MSNVLVSHKSNLSPAKQAVLEKYLKARIKGQHLSEGIPKKNAAIAPLSFAQQRLWLLCQLEPNSAAYNIPTALRISGKIDLPAMEKAVNEIIRRHEILRTKFVTIAEQPQQVIVPEIKISILIDDISEFPGGLRDSEVQNRIKAEGLKPFNLSECPLFRTSLLHLGQSPGKEEYVFLITMHHIISDGWSAAILFREFTTLYTAYRNGMPPSLADLPVQYADFACWQRNWLQGERLEEQLNYWQEQLRGIPGLLKLPIDHPRPAVQNENGKTHAFSISSDLTQNLHLFCQRRGVTFFATLLSALDILLYRYGGQSDICVGIPVANRNRLETEGLIGFFVNTLVLRSDLSGNPYVKDLLRKINQTALEAQSHQDLPFEKLVEAIQPVRDLSYSPLFQVMFVLHNVPLEALAIEGLTISPLDVDYGTSKFDLLLHITERNGQVDAALEYSTDLFEQETIMRLAVHFEALLKGIVQASDYVRLSQLPLLSDSERQRMLVEWNNTKTEFSKTLSFPGLFEAQAATTPNAQAVVFRNESLSYKELNRRANKVAHALIKLGVKPDMTVALLAERGIDLLTMILGVFKAGGAYLPLDTNHPVQRLQEILDLGRISLLVVEENHFGKSSAMLGFKEKTALCQVVSFGSLLFGESNENNPKVSVLPNQLAYVIFTSGSTGIPKGAMVEQKGMLNNLLSKVATLNLTTSDAIAQTASQCFDISVWQFLAALVAGGCIHILPDEVSHDPQRLLEIVEGQGITVLESVPSLIKEMLEIDSHVLLSKLRWMLPTGEALPPDLCQRWLKRYPYIPLLNAYGPAECSDDVSYHLITESPGSGVAQMPIGRPISNVQLYILDSFLEPVPIGVVGELHCAGFGVGRGYLNDPLRTAKSFIPDPFTSHPGGRIYKTGDLARYLQDGTIEYLGRIDHQVKIRGFRIELGEIEARLLQHSEVKEAVVVDWGDTPSDRRLVAYVVSKEENLAIAALRDHLKTALPDYMVPAAFVFLPALPLSPNGKLDRKVLPDPDVTAQFIHQYVPPRNATEEILAGIWAEVLGVERVGIYDNFFELGGHSLLAVTLIERLRRRGLLVEVRTLFGTPTVAEMAAAVVKGECVLEVPPNGIPDHCEAITPEMLPLVDLSQVEIENIVGQVPGGAKNVQDIYPLAPLQEGILFHHLMATAGDAYLSSTLLAFDTRERLDGFLIALQAVIDRHDILRTAIAWEGTPEAIQVVWRDAPLSIEEILLDAGAGDAAEQLCTRFDPRRFRLDVRRAPLLCGFMSSDIAHERWLLLLLVHHLALDHTALEVVVEEIQAQVRGETHRQFESQPFRSFVAQARLGVSREEHETFFRAMLGDVEEPTAPFGLLDVQGDGVGVEEASLLLDVELAGRLRRHARVLGVSAASLCHLAWAQVLGRASGRDDVVFGTVLFGRMYGGEGIDRALGLFMNTLPIRNRLEEGVVKAVKDTHALLAELLQHEHASLALAQRCSGVSAPMPLFSALLNYRYDSQGHPTASSQPASPWEGMEVLVSEERTNYPLTLSVDDFGDGFRLIAQAQSPIEPQRICRYMETALIHLVVALETAPKTAVRSIEILPDLERYQLLEDWNATQIEYPKDKLIYQLFESQVEQTPEAVALLFENRSLTYLELNARSNQLAHHLQSLGVVSDTIVGLCVERSLEMVIGILGILKAGGAYLPLDPDYPRDRLEFMLANAKPAVLLSQAKWREALPEYPMVIYLDSDWSKIAVEREQNPMNRMDARNLAYVIYTSGSTGRPKGVGVPHEGLLNRLQWMQERFELNASDAVLQKTPYSFDVSVWEFFWPLIAGARLIVAGPNDHKDPERLISLIETHSVTTIHFVPSMLRVFLEATAANCCPTLKRVICSGEALTPELRQLFFSRHNAELHNLYGPTEASIDVTAWQCQKDDSAPCVPIGRPIANTRTYILDRYFNPAPVGVPGELCLGGIQLARGYLNRPDLTAERFIPDLYGELEGERLYRTGDLASYRADGVIDYLGRIDRQVKIRGFRIELGEIEARLLQHPLVKEAVVITQEGQLTDKRLVAYVVGREESIGSEALREHLKAVLPEYMVPAVFIFLQTLPLTVSGKLDRKALPAPDSSHLSTTRYIAPRNQVEQTLAGLWSGVLGIERIGIHDDFFALGGHSILATQLLFRIRESFSCNLPLLDLFQASTIASQARLLVADNVNEYSNEDSIDWKAESTLDESVCPASQYRPEFALKSVFLTGSTGFLGVFLLKELLQQTRMNIYCLVRAATPAQGFEKIERSLDNYGLWDSDYVSRIYPVCGDLSKPRLGIQTSQWQKLAGEIDAIYHNGALVNFVYPYATLKPANVSGTQEVLRLACTAKVKPVHYISSVSVFEDDSNFDLGIVMEDNFPEDGTGLVGGYAQSKWVAEKMVRIAGSRGLPVSIYRPSIITGDSRSGVWNTGDYLSNVIGACLLLGKAPMQESLFNTVPVDYVSRTLVFLSGQPQAIGNTYHLTNPGLLSSNQLIDWACAAGLPLERVDFNDWLTGLRDLVGNSSDHPFFSLLPMLDQEEMNFTKNEDSDIRTPTYDCKNVIAGLSGTGIICPTPDERLWSVYFKYLQKAYAGHPSVAV
ncbi:non-ribosomal peptide synthetase [Methylicorpusculum sp.]|uniref:non-ribosomal peptide synthetase n=1 Tax=Methylicorpusculum sp. TaxID=2713644 RepID=UPI00271FA929|nr:non-ribosomal peptide synthetase [Methylicorpusculum sp.]MDO8844058.1 amino acid adenylation domain-containing protein [Methylicorpusculum sp.]